MTLDKINYELEYEKICKSLTSKPKLLLHSCCAPCSSSVLARVCENFDVTIMNLANGDMVGHTGVYEAAVQAV